MSEKFCLKWNDFESNVSKSFGLLRNEEYLHDVTLVCDDNSQVSAHKLVLSACSEYFKTIFRNNSHPSPLICLEGVSSPDLRNILDYMYNGEANIFQENLDKFLSLAQRLKILGLLQSNSDYDDDLLENVKAENHSSNEKEDTLPEYNDKDQNLTINAENGIRINSKCPKNNDRRMSLTNNGDQQEEIDRKVDEHIETCLDGTFKCLFCGKIDSSNRTKGNLQNIRAHVETHLEGISYQCTKCEKTFRSRNSFSKHKGTHK